MWPAAFKTSFIPKAVPSGCLWSSQIALANTIVVTLHLSGVRRDVVFIGNFIFSWFRGSKGGGLV